VETPLTNTESLDFEEVSVPENSHPTQRYFMHMAYCGTNFCGWQIQANAETIQQTLKESMERILQVPINVIGCGRTDTGVHATEYYAHFDLKRDMPDRFLMKLNAVLPVGIAVYEIFPVEHNAHSRFHATQRSYQYFIHTRKNPFLKLNSYEFIYYDLDWDLIIKATELLRNYGEFKPLVKVDKDQPKYNCTIFHVGWTQLSDHEWRFDITANRFLYNMIRRIVGTMILIGRHQLTIEEFVEVMDAQSEFRNIKLAPPNGLHLSKVKYPFIDN
jgi:tRNA pseudouridine38-40 synthase